MLRLVPLHQISFQPQSLRFFRGFVSTRSAVSSREESELPILLLSNLRGNQDILRIFGSIRTGFISVFQSSQKLPLKFQKVPFHAHYEEQHRVRAVRRGPRTTETSQTNARRMSYAVESSRVRFQLKLAPEVITKFSDAVRASTADAVSSDSNCKNLCISFYSRYPVVV